MVSLKRSFVGAALAVGLIGLSGCATGDDVDGTGAAVSEAIDAEGRKVLEAQLAILENPSDGDILEGPEATAALAKLATQMPGERDYADLGLEGAPADVLARAKRDVVRLTWEASKGKPARSVTVALFRWPGKTAGESIAVTLIQPSNAPAFSYAERIRGSTVELFRLEGNASRRVFKEEADREASALGPQALAIETGLGIRAEWSRAGKDRWCNACAVTYRGVYVMGAIASRLAGTPAAGWLCRTLGFSAGALAAPSGPGAVVVGGGTFAACMSVISWIGTAAAGATLLGTWPNTEKTTQVCNAVSNNLGWGDVCITGGPKECSPEEFAARRNNPVEKCTQYGMCARANKCNLDNAAICAATCSQEGGGFGSSRTEEQKRTRDRCIELCTEITNRTCQRAAPLTERSEMIPECRSYLSP